MTLRTLLLSAACATAVAAPAMAVVNINVTEDGSGVTFAYSGSLDLTGMFLFVSSSGSFASFSNSGHVEAIASGYDLYQSLNSNLGVFTSNTYGTFVGSVSGDSFSSGSTYVGVKSGYTSGDAINGSMFFAGETIASLDLFVGNYTATLPSDTITMSISAAPVPLPASAVLLAAGVAGIAATKRRRKA